jgi:hypothetical protein
MMTIFNNMLRDQRAPSGATQAFLFFSVIFKEVESGIYAGHGNVY